MTRVDARAPLWRHLANVQLAATLASAGYVWLVNGLDEAVPAGTGLLAAAFRTAWSYGYVRYCLAPGVNRVLRRAPRSRAGRLAASLGESLWPQSIDALFFCLIGAERVLSVLPFVATNTASVFLAAEAALAGRAIMRRARLCPNIPPPS